jgi:class 3 adenylate cyclase
MARTKAGWRKRRDSRVETAGEPGKVNISAETHRQVKDLFDCEHRGTIATRGKKDLEMYFLIGQRTGTERASGAAR